MRNTAMYIRDAAHTHQLSATILILTSLKTSLQIDSKTANRDDYSKFNVTPTSCVPPRPQQSSLTAETLSLPAFITPHPSSVTLQLQHGL
jgi:hypothetical protein